MGNNVIFKMDQTKRKDRGLEGLRDFAEVFFRKLRK